ncbi:MULTISPECIES: strawberry notch family protein [Rhodobacterales]|uniref:Methylase n=1 Tax=Pelagivirga sediminicola TaxID=2170575 RepID=A0A2T7G3P1_9RHOB|nr:MULTISPECIES: strawberry notch family protein [Rhodobacterales]MCQ0090363.1 methylase [Roseovarius sp. M141]PVA09037.1 methylase [Pelagivirga sediminicola]
MTDIPAEITPSRAASLLQAANHLLPHFEQGKALDQACVRDAMEIAFGGTDTSGAWVWKDGYEAGECAQILLLLKYGALMRRQCAAPAKFLGVVEKVAGLALSHTRRSERSQKLQQFSTPLPLAAIVAEAAQIREDDVVLEPSAGTGLLAIYAQLAGAELHLNEIDETRADLLSRLFPDAAISHHDAGSIDDRLEGGITPNIIVMNPPFSAAPGVEGRYKPAMGQHVLSSLDRLQPDGRLVVVSGANFSPANTAFRSAFKRISESASIRFSAPIAGRVYARHGTTTETRLTVIDKRGGLTQDQNAAYHEQAESSQALLALVQAHCPSRLVNDRENQPTDRTTAPTSSSSARSSSIQSLRDKARSQIRANEAEKARHPFDQMEASEIAYLPKVWAEKSTRLTEALYEGYEVQSITIENAQPHPTALVQSAAMASVAPPTPSYRPKIHASLITDGALSDAQLESIIYAGEAHEQHLSSWFRHDAEDQGLVACEAESENGFQLRKGWFLGDGTGCGKGRQVAGIILDNWLRGRKRAVWISKSDKLIEDAIRDWTAIGGRATDIVPLSRFKQGSEIRFEQGILFATYATLRTAERQQGDILKASRLDQVTAWLGKDFDGVIAFDEAHAMANAAGEKGKEGGRGDRKASQQGLAGLKLQNLVPDARVLYVSATGATIVGNLAYASRLGLWATGDSPFATREQFIADMEAGGIAAMEIISRDLKALGLYLARSLSYEGVEYEMLVHELTPAQRDIYDSYAEAFQVIHTNLEAALEAVGVTADGSTLNVQAKAAARSAFESNKQRFFNHLITAMKCPSVIKSIESDLQNGASAVVQIVSTSEALMERRLAQIPASEWHDLHVDITPREYVVDYLMHSFPTQLFEPYTDEDGNLKSRPALDGDGNPIECREAARKRDAMVERLGALAPVQGALDQIFWHFGKDQVAEVTGRSRRIVRTRDQRLKVENRPGSSNIGEAQAFMDDAKRILIFSDAGGTGRSYHADLGVKNQRLRVHYLLEPGWRADNAIQGLGRTNRTNQAQPPLFRPCATNVKGEKRFLSTIARRLDTLGAITKGQRETGGQNMFRAEDNLESAYARKALRNFFWDLTKGRISACSQTRFEEMTGLSLMDGDGTLKEQLPPIQQFLNRCLALTIDMQDAIFECFGGLLEAIIDDASAAGTYEVGLETLRAEKFEIIDRKVIFEHAATGATATALTVERTDRNHPLSLEKVKEFCMGSSSARLMLNRKSERAAVLVPTSSLMTEEGEPIARVELRRPMATDRMLELELPASHWEEVNDFEFERAWSKEVDAVPETSISKLTLISGLLLPIWDRLPTDNMRIYRLQTEDGERAIGRMVTQDQMANVYAALGLDCSVELTAAEIFDAVLKRGQSLPLSGGLTLRRSRVMSAYRLELTGYNGAALESYKAMGCFTEIISWATRLFVPTDDTNVVDQIMTRHKITAAGTGERSAA